MYGDRFVSGYGDIFVFLHKDRYEIQNGDISVLLRKDVFASTDKIVIRGKVCRSGLFVSSRHT